jgi:hypothetical protein
MDPRLSPSSPLVGGHVALLHPGPGRAPPPQQGPPGPAGTHAITLLLHWCYTDVTLYYTVVTLLRRRLNRDPRDPQAHTQSHCCYTVLHGCYTVVTLLLHCCYTVLTLLLHGCYTVVTLLLHCCYTVLTLLLHCCYTVVTLLLHCCYTVVTLLSHCCAAASTGTLRHTHTHRHLCYSLTS